MTYRPTPAGLARDLVAVEWMLAVAHHRLDMMGVDRPNRRPKITAAGDAVDTPGGYELESLTEQQPNHV